MARRLAAVLVIATTFVGCQALLDLEPRRESDAAVTPTPPPPEAGDEGSPPSPPTGGTFCTRPDAGAPGELVFCDDFDHDASVGAKWEDTELQSGGRVGVALGHSFPYALEVTIPSRSADSGGARAALFRALDAGGGKELHIRMMLRLVEWGRTSTTTWRGVLGLGFDEAACVTELGTNRRRISLVFEGPNLSLVVVGFQGECHNDGGGDIRRTTLAGAGIIDALVGEWLPIELVFRSVPCEGDTTGEATSSVIVLGIDDPPSCTPLVVDPLTKVEDLQISLGSATGSSHGPVHIEYDDFEVVMVR